MSHQILYGAAYYPEYLPVSRLEEDFRLMTQAGFNTIRVAESTWSTWEPREGEFDFSLLRQTLDKAEECGLSVIVGTPTYAIPPWLARKYPDILAETHAGTNRYGPRQNFDITHPGYRFHAERIIRKLMEAVQGYDCVIGFQLDNETKAYDTCSPRAQQLFKEALQAKYSTVEALNRALGLAYWSNSLGSWEDLPDVRATINGSFGAAYQAFQRQLVTDFLRWQRQIVDQYRRPDQFVTHNFDFHWKGHSYGLQPEVDQFQAAQAVTRSGCDIYHPGGEDLTGAEISFCGSLARSWKGQTNYLVLETQAQGNLGWTPLPGQLRLQAFAHLAAGAEGISYWHWHSIHNAVESYWKGVLSHDLKPHQTYWDAAETGRDLARLSSHLLHLRKENKVAVVVSSAAQDGLNWFPSSLQWETPERDYSDFLRWICDALYHLNAEYDVVSGECRDFSGYQAVFCPALYAAGDGLIQALRDYVAGGGHLLATFRSFYAGEDLTIRHGSQPYGLTDVFGMTYDRYTRPGTAALRGECFSPEEAPQVSCWMELLEPSTAQVLAAYDRSGWAGIPAVTRNAFGQGEAVWLGCYFSQAALEGLLEGLLPDWGIPLSPYRFPLVVKRGRNALGREISYYLNFSQVPQTWSAPQGGVELRSGRQVAAGEPVSLAPWGVHILESR